MMTNKNIAIAKLINLQNALAECGIESELLNYTAGEEGQSQTTFITLRADLWNSISDKEIFMEVYAEDTDDYEEIQHYAQSEFEDEAFQQHLEDAIAEAENKQQ